MSMPDTFDKNSIIVTVLFCVLLALAICSNYTMMLFGDREWLLICARYWLDGKRLYTDIFELNPPLIIWIDAVAVMLARVLHMEEFHALLGIGFVTIASVTALSVKTIKAHPVFSCNAHMQWEFAAVILFLMLVFEPPASFFDRDHIFLVLVFPYLIRFMPCIDKTKLPAFLRVTTGLLAGIGFCIKPYCMIVLATILLLVLLRTQSIRALCAIENILIALIGFFYLASIAIFAREYLNTVLPMAIATYSIYFTPGLKTTNLTITLLMMAALAPACINRTSPLRKEIRYFLGVIAGFSGYAMANNGWTYTFFPLWTCILFAVPFLLWNGRMENAGMLSCRMILPLLVAILSLTVSIVHFSFFNRQECIEANECKLRTLLLSSLKHNNAHSYAAFAPTFIQLLDVGTAHGVEWKLRFNHLWMMPQLFAGGDAFLKSHEWIADYFSHALAEDINTRKPDVLFIDDSPQMVHVHRRVDLLGFLDRYPYFHQAFSAYRLVETVDVCTEYRQVVCRYKVFRHH